MPDPKQSIDEQNVYIRDTLLSIASKYADVLKDAVEDAFDNVDAGVLKAVGNDLTRSFTKLAKMSDELALNTSRINKGLLSQKDIEKQIQSLQEKRESIMIKIAHARKLGADIGEEDLENALKSLDIQEKQLEEDKKLAKSLSFRIGMQKGFNDIQDKFNVKQIKDSLTISGIFGLIIQGALNFQKQSVETGKILGYSASESNRIQSNFNKLAFTTENVNVNSKSLNEAFTQLAQSTGYVSEYSDDTLITQIKLTKQVGLTGEEAAQFQRYSVLTGQSSEQVYKSFVKGLVAQRNQSRIGINFKTTLAEAAKISGQLAAQLGYNPERIARAVVKAKEFGMTLEQTAKISESLLNFESSIENELKAELLTGKQLNLERARAAALSGDQATVAEEIAKNIGTAADFAKMNVLQQKSLAESVGMTADELGETLRKREEALASGKSLAQVTEEEAAKSLERQAIQEKFNAAIEKLQSLIGGIVAGPLGTMLEILIQSVDYINAAVIGLGAYYAISKSIQITQGVITGLKAAQLASDRGMNAATFIRRGLLGKELSQTIAIAVAKIAGASAQTLGIAAGIALAAGAAAYTYFNSMDDGVIGPGGETVVSGPKGSIKLNKDDSIVAGTNLFDKGNNQTISPSIDLTPMIAAINQVKASVDRLYSKNTTISMDGKAVGTTLTQGSYKFA
jgi:hypothetical protein